MLLLVVGALVVLGLLALGLALVPGRVGPVVGDVAWREAWLLAWAARTGRLRSTGRPLEDVLRRDRACRIAERWLQKHRENGWWPVLGAVFPAVGLAWGASGPGLVVAAIGAVLLTAALVPLERRLLQRSVRRLRTAPGAS